MVPAMMSRLSIGDAPWGGSHRPRHKAGATQRKTKSFYLSVWRIE
jgi:hypothetical protein